MITIEHLKHEIIVHAPFLERKGMEKYLVGQGKPNYPMPSLYCFSLISKEVDKRACDMNVTDMMLSLL